jgi:hypothetical protein
MTRFVIDYALSHDSLEGGEPGFYVIDLLGDPWQDVIARFLQEDRAEEYCRLINATLGGPPPA